MDAYVFLGCASPWVYALATALAQQGNATLVIALYDTRTYRRLSSAWPAGDVPPCLTRERWVLPPGYAGALAPLFNPLLRYKLRRSLARLAAGDDARPWVITPYPWFGPAAASVPGARLIYYNYDDYTLFRPRRAAKILRQECALVRRARLTLCSSQEQVATLSKRYPAKAAAIRHFPHGMLEKFLNPEPLNIPSARTVGYVGNLIDRVDWGLVGDVVGRMPEVEFVFVGGLEGSAGGGADADWERKRAAALARPNVRRVGPVAQHEVAAHYWSFAVNWIPYAVDHAFKPGVLPDEDHGWAG